MRVAALEQGQECEIHGDVKRDRLCISEIWLSVAMMRSMDIPCFGRSPTCIRFGVDHPASGTSRMVARRIS